MTRDETIDVLSARRTLWPHSPVGDDFEVAVGVWQRMLDAFPAGDVMDALAERSAAGDRHAPLVGEIVKTLTERAIGAPDFDEAWRDMCRVIRRTPAMRTPRPEAFQHPLTAAWAIPAWNELRMGPAEGTSAFGTHYAQQREAFRACAARGQRQVALAAVGAPRRRDRLGRLDPLAGLRPPLVAIEGGAS